VNLGCPQCFLPGYMAPMETAAESFFFVWAFYCGILWLAAKGGMKVMRWSEAKWPHLGRVGLAVILYGAFLVFDLVTEVFWIRLGLYSYEGATGPFVLFPGHYYQIPMYEILLAGVWYSSIIMLWYYRNDKGQTIVERGADQLRGSARRSRGVRTLALIGGFNLLFALLYNLPLTWISAQSNEWPKDAYTRSYFTQGICGPGTDTACPDGRLPLTREGSARISPDGTLVAPRGLPVQVDE
jgi:hypothetical protein